MWPLILAGGVVYLITRTGADASAVLDEATAEDDPSATGDDYHAALDMEQTVASNIPAAAQQYLGIIQDAAAGSDWDPLILVGIGQHESRWGTSPLLDEMGPGGTGDFSVRSRSAWGKTPGVQFVGGLYGKWKNPGGLASIVNNLPNFTVPGDSRGWGRGLMQIDYGRARSIDWADPEANIREAVAVLNEKRKYISSHVDGLSNDELIQASVAAYNTGQGNVVKSLIAGRDVDATTTGGDYSAAVLKAADGWRMS